MDALATSATPAMIDLPANTPTPTMAQTPDPTNPALPKVSIIDCHICVCMSIRRPAWEQPGPSKMCVLCVRQYCSMHAASANEVGGKDVCEIKHQMYYRKHPQRWANGVLPTLDARDARMARGL